MDFIWNKVTEWLKGILIGGIMGNLQGLFDNVNQQVSGIAGQVGTTPQAWNSGVYSMIRSLSDNVILPIAGVILAIVMTMELLQLVLEKNNLQNFETWIFFKWIFKTFCAILIVTNTWDIIMGMLIVQDQVWGRVTANRSVGKATRYYVDEFHLLLKEEQTASYSVEILEALPQMGRHSHGDYAERQRPSEQPGSGEYL